jgi:hypothetical protein
MSLRYVALALKVRVEKSTSRSGLHTRISTYLIVGRGCVKTAPLQTSRVPTKPTYAKGEAHEVMLEVPSNYYVVAVDMRRNPRKMVRGDIVVYSWDGGVLLRAVYRKLKIRVVECYVDRRLAEELVRCVYSTLKLPVKRYGVSRCKI